MEKRNKELLEFESGLVLKNYLMLKDEEELRTLYSGIDNYVIFLDTVIYLLNHEPAFLFISNSFLKKIHSVLQIHRFDIDNEEISRAINDVTVFLNEVENSDIDDTRLIVSSYLDWERDVRKFESASIERLLDSISDDAVIFSHLDGFIDASSKEKYPMLNEVKLASINYLLEMIPEFFSDPVVQDRTIKMVDDIYKETSIFNKNDRKASKELKQKLKSLFREE